MILEQYTLILTHEIVGEGIGKIQLENPIILTHAFDRRICGPSIVLNEMLDHFKYEVLKAVKNID